MPPILRRVVGCALSLLLVLTGVSVAFPASPNDVDIELWYDGTWNNINQYVYHRSMTPIVITRGRANEARACDPGTMTLEINNRDGRFSPKNPDSPLFGKIGRNTPIRTKVTYNAVTYIRFTGEVPSWPSRWDASGRDVWVPVSASGILRRLGQGSKPLRSPMFRAISGVAAGDYVPHAYWPMEDGADATQFGSGLGTGSPATVSGAVEFAADLDLVGSDPLPTVGAGAVISATIPTYTDTGQLVIQLAVKIDSEPASNTTILEVDTPGGSSVLWRLYIEPGSPTNLWWAGYNSAGAPTTSAASITLAGLPGVSPTESEFYGRWWFYTLSTRLASPGEVWGTFSLTDDADFASTSFGTESPSAAHAAGRSMRLYGSSGLALGHWAVFTDPAFDVTSDAFLNAAGMHGHAGETADERFERLCRQAQIPSAASVPPSATMGAERAVSLLQALRDCEAADQGFLCETRDSLGLRFVTNASRYNQVPIQLDYGAGHISAPFDPEPDDRGVANDREVKRREGSSARRELTSGSLSTQDPPDGVGRYDDSITVDVYSDDQVEHMASWRLHVGTWDAERYPRVRVDLSANFGANADLIPLIAAADSGSLITIDNLPAWLPPETCELLVEGYREVIGFYDWDFTFNCSPAGAYNVVGVWGLLGQELHTAMNTSTTSADIATTSGPLLKTSGLGSGYRVAIGAEHLQVTAVAASTVTYGAAGTAAHANNASVVANLPADVAEGHLLLCFAAIRNSGTGVVNAPTGYTRLPVFPSTSNAQLFAKIATSSESNPTVTITGGAANADVSAQMIRLTGKWHDVDNIIASKGKAYASCLNASAQNITYPGLALPQDPDCIILYLGWKQDDWTDVTSPGTEIGEPDTTTGDDQGIVWAYGIQTTATAITSGVFTVNGGASAISRGAVVALRCDYQTATVTRSVNGVTASHSAADAVTAVNPLRWALI